MPAPLFVADRLQALIDALPRDQLGFAPVPVKPRHDGWTAVRQRGFIDRLALCGCIRSTATARQPPFDEGLVIAETAASLQRMTIADATLEIASHGRLCC